ncbi:MBL fold metallo-hydrolase [Nocardioides dongxiaopingii]|uniref:MBL fold metallo-hydrolase n=1 Tax=Nocardioides dongxiaopingii TaxID=2576036 RepID=UPI001BAFE887|nr:MBL fold metallo-hydrolase [Nocardioides dongxiaopingii]
MIHHLNCASFHPPIVGAMVTHVLLVERAGGLLLVDTGFGTADVASPQRLGRAFKALMRPQLRDDETALAQVTALGHAADDVTDIVLTHMDLDHVGGVGDFPRARVHVYEAELAAARDPHGMEHGRYLPAQWQDADFVTHRTRGPGGGSGTGVDWFGFESVTVLGDDVLMVPLAGHSRGHALVAVRDGDAWLAHAGDAYFHRGDLAAPTSGPRTLRVVQRLMAQDDELRRANRDRLGELVRAGHDGLRVFSAHDPVELAAFATTG